jgi:hypothetical protein
MNMSGRRILKTTAAVVGISALGALGAGTAFAATPTDLGDAPTGHGTSTMDKVDLSSPASSKGSDLHTFAMPKMATHIAEPTTRYNDNNDNSDYGSSNSDYNDDNNSGYNDNSDYNHNNSDYNDNNGYYNHGYYNHGYYNDGYGHNDNGLLGGGLLGGNN